MFFNQTNKYFSKATIIIVAFNLVLINCLKVNAENLEQYLILKSNYKNNKQNKNRKYNSILINEIKKNKQNKVILTSKSINIEKLLYEKSEKTMAMDSIFIEGFLNKIKINKFIGNSSFIYPVIGSITSGFGMREHPVFKIRSFHSGIDIAAPLNSPVIASNSGKIIYTGLRSGYGNMVIINHGNLNGMFITSIYGHLSKILVINNQTVKKGQIIGLEGKTGTTTGPHLHFELRKDGKPVNPVNFVK